jgi:tripartite-type tricarboxylate transporter receptor subunit TctC
MRLGGAVVVLAVCACMTISPAAAQETNAADYPSRGITMVMPLAAGSAGDVLGRLVGAKMALDLGRPIVSENVTGASGAIGIERVLRAAPDGYTLLGTGDNQLIYAPLFNKSARFDPRTDLAPITQLAVLDWALVANPAFPAKTISELTALAKARPGVINFASGGVGSAQQIAMELLMARSHIKLTHVPYRGVTPALNDVVAGVVPLIFTAVSVAVPYLPDGKLRVLATTGRQRSTLLPDVPTVAESGIAGFEFTTWMGLLAPKGTPTAIVERLNRSAATAVKDAALRPQMAAGGFAPVGNSPAEFKAVLASDYQRIADVVREAGIAPN